MRVWGQVERETTWSWDEFSRLPSVERIAEPLCGAGRQLEGARWTGVQTRELLSRTRLRPSATFVMVHAYGGHSTGLSLHSFGSADALFAWGLDGRPLTPERGWPLRLVVPGSGAPQSVKWVNGLEFLNKNWPATLDAAGDTCLP